MQMGKHPVNITEKDENGKTVRREVGVANFKIYETASEALDDLGEVALLDLLNAQVRTNELNRVRGMARQGPGKKALQQKAIASITAEEWQRIAGNQEAIERLINERMDELAKEERAKVGVIDDGEED